MRVHQHGKEAVIWTSARRPRSVSLIRSSRRRRVSAFLVILNPQHFKSHSPIAPIPGVQVCMSSSRSELTGTANGQAGHSGCLAVHDIQQHPAISYIVVPLFPPLPPPLPASPSGRFPLPHSVARRRTQVRHLGHTITTATGACIRKKSSPPSATTVQAPLQSLSSRQALARRTSQPRASSPCRAGTY